MPLSITVPSLVSDTRNMSGLRGNQFCTDPEIVGYLSDGQAELFDKFVEVLESYVLKSFDFTLTTASNVVTLPADFQKDNGLDDTRNPAQPISVPMLPNWEERNGPSVGLGLNSIVPGPGRCYWIQGSETSSAAGESIVTTLRVLPNASVAAGTYRLWYTPEMPTLKDPSIAWTTGDHTTGFTNDLVLAAASFDASYLGQSITLSGTVSNNGTFTIATVVSATHVTTVQALAGESLPATTLIASQPAGTTGTVPTIFAPWAVYLKVYASVAIRTKRQQDCADLQGKLTQLNARIAKMAPNKTMSVIQAPITRRWISGLGGRGWGNGF